MGLESQPVDYGYVNFSCSLSLVKPIMIVDIWGEFAGAFAQFGPGEFESLYDSLNSPAAKGRLHFAGEALSVRHACVAS